MAVLGERAHLSVVQHHALVGAHSAGSRNPMEEKELAYALLAAGYATEVITEHVYLTLIPHPTN
ncbi:MAG: hypothetical protein M3Y48_19855 [Actinomycetota bacterium]|nr:hypothetical protein [Actinomycetota bacterium]